MKLRFKKGAQPVKRWKKRPRRKIYIHTIASIFHEYNNDLLRANLLFEAFSYERRQAQRVALDRLHTKLDNLGLKDLFEWQDAYNFVINYNNQYIEPEPKQAVSR